MEQKEFTFAGGSPGQKPVDGLVITRNNTRSKTFPKEMHEPGLKPVIASQLCTAPDTISPCKRGILEA